MHLVKFPWSPCRSEFTRYSSLVQGVLSDTSDDSSTICFIHSPIEDLSTPSCNDDLLGLLSTLLQHLESDTETTLCTYTVGVVEEELGWLVVWWVPCCFRNCRHKKYLHGCMQAGYDTRHGATSMHPSLRRSPQTEQQRSSRLFEYRGAEESVDIIYSTFPRYTEMVDNFRRWW